MNVFYGIFMALIGLFFAICATKKSSFGMYRILAARSRILWGDQVHLFYQITGGILLVLGLLWAAGVLWTP